MYNRRSRVHLSKPGDTIDPVSQKSRHYQRLSEFYERGFDWVTKLRSHTSCVNAVNFSQKGGRWLASGGDDLRVLLWDMYETEIKTPIHTFTGPRRNIFELAFTANNEYLLCGGADTAIQRYDLTRLGHSFNPDPVETFRKHKDSIRGITPHITKDALYMTASEEGKLFYHDARSPRPSGHLVSQGGWVGIQFHPRLEHLFIGATDQRRGRVSLFDMRKCFGQSIDAESKELMRYATQPIADRPLYTSLCDIAFDRSGEIFATTNQHHYPTIYALSDPYPIALCTAERLPSGEPTPPTQRSYSNTCTTKHLSFGGPPSDLTSSNGTVNDADQYLATGSDDFRGYVWKIPSTATLLANRKEIENDDGEWSPPKGQFGYIMSALDETLRVPMKLNQPAFRLGGHQSIVNTARWHPVMPRIATCGIESKVVLHEYCDSLTGSVKTDSAKVRRRVGGSLATRAIGRNRASSRAQNLNEVMGEESEEISDEEDSSTILYFDDILANDEERSRSNRNRHVNVGDGDDSDELTGGPGDLVESDDVNPRDRARLMAIFARLLASSDLFGGSDETETPQEGTIRILRAMVEGSDDDDEGSHGEIWSATGGDDNDDEGEDGPRSPQQMDMSE
ncbi:hypothetical protein M408DRAFT_79690 [Serendipita vermifera MAFF 305830]|uniref:Uncharacterized protein n=1 Tax=Serendipita vermifera MAFF 305830 TaxID=933852 RepID=A0A0C2WXD0_SERVB|nr:hypothetical protein M408DRAFT_79690 [Serendipita vermifera MAFF 305830]